MFEELPNIQEAKQYITHAEIEIYYEVYSRLKTLVERTVLTREANLSFTCDRYSEFQLGNMSNIIVSVYKVINDIVILQISSDNDNIDINKILLIPDDKQYENKYNLLAIKKGETIILSPPQNNIYGYTYKITLNNITLGQMQDL